MHHPRPYLLAALLAACSLSLSAAGYRAPDAHDDGWPVADARAGHIDTTPFAALEGKIADGSFKNITSVLVARDGKLVYEHYFNGSDAGHLNDVRSASKSVTALLAGAAIDRGLIPGVQAKVYGFFPDKQPVQHADPRKQAITLEDLLTMSSLWECNDENEFSAGNEERMYVSEDWLQFALDLPIKGFAPWMAKPADSPHGRAFSYCTAGAFVSGAVVERAARMPLSRFAADALEKPLGIEHVQWNASPLGIGMGGGGTRYRSRDLAKLGQLALDDGRWHGRQVISAAWIHAMLTVHAQARDDADYGYLWWCFRKPVTGIDEPVWAMSGNGGNYVFVVPSRRLVAVVTSTAYNQRYAHPQSQEILREYLLKAVSGAR
ncbi:serine hydrolase [Dyella sp. SG609]|uniref:serine hydrolase domain-containing protein n=1 Tax=Dyella sp. SG609 TaxID=2587018 RepID=UPI0014486C37|nr:serine hydrolase [Dyella sp. SG609]NKJ22599.1 CubicO group peptidase (beta-lactamase class C family) [Dyella sp. SG609]